MASRIAHRATVMQEAACCQRPYAAVIVNDTCQHNVRAGLIAERLSLRFSEGLAGRRDVRRGTRRVSSKGTTCNPSCRARRSVQLLGLRLDLVNDLSRDHQLDFWRRRFVKSTLFKMAWANWCAGSGLMGMPVSVIPQARLFRNVHIP